MGFGLGYSATRIQGHAPRSHTILEMHPVVRPRRGVLLLLVLLLVVVLVVLVLLVALLRLRLRRLLRLVAVLTRRWQVARRAREWAAGRAGVIIVEATWQVRLSRHHCRGIFRHHCHKMIPPALP